MLATALSVVHIFICLFLIAIVLLQQGKGADVGAAFGGGSNTFFGAGGADNLLTRVTTISAGCFMLTSILLSVYMKNGGFGPNPSGGNLFKDLPKESAPAQTTVPLNVTPPQPIPAGDAAPAQPAGENAEAANAGAKAAAGENAAPEAPPAAAEKPAAPANGEPELLPGSVSGTTAPDSPPANQGASNEPVSNEAAPAPAH